MRANVHKKNKKNEKRGEIEREIKIDKKQRNYIREPKEPFRGTLNVAHQDAAETMTR
eukprot:SAG31_NODE_258_length_18937_cov_61.688555_24_plen_57_part_00